MLRLPPSATPSPAVNRTRRDGYLADSLTARWLPCTLGARRLTAARARLKYEGWKDFVVAASGAASDSGGLAFVALSIDVTKILEIPGLPARAKETP